jgi:protein-S-isoprenylcysteine O-methyltransferase Ste14
MSSQGDRTFSDVLQDIIGNVQSIIRSEIQLAKTETKEEATKAARASGVIALGAVLGLYAFGFLLLTIARSLEQIMPSWLASLMVSVLAGLCAFGALSVGRKRIKQVHPTPAKTIQTVKEDIEWVKGQTK